jgi:predicted phage terminase large subunit-like protein
MVVSPTYPMLRDTVLKTFREITDGVGIVKSFNVATMTAELMGNRTILFRSADKPDRLRGVNAGWIWVDEAGYVDHQTWLVCIGRLRREPRRIWLTSTPKGTRHWMYDLVKTGQISMTQATSASNVYNPPEFVESLEGAYSADWQRQELMGEFVEPGGTLFKRTWFQSVDELPNAERLSVRAWDCAATPGGGDHSVGLRMHKIAGKYYIDSIVRGQWGPDELDTIQKQTAEADGQNVTVLLEREPGSAGKRANQYVRQNLSDFHVVEESPSGSKYQRALPAAKESAKGGIILTRGNWITAFLDEVADFNGEDGQTDDQVDALSLAFNYLMRKVGVSV